MTEERLLGDLCEAEGLAQPLYDLEVTGGELETVCCVVGRSFTRLTLSASSAVLAG